MSFGHPAALAGSAAREATGLAVVRVPVHVLTLIMLIAWAALLAASALQDLLLGVDTTRRIWRLDLDVEQSIYTWFSTVLLASAAALLSVLATAVWHSGRPYRWHWALLALIFLGLSADEALSLHEWLSGYVSDALGTDGYLYFAWVIPLGLAALIGLVAYLPFIASFPRDLAAWLLVSAMLFIGGAVGVEMLAGNVVSSDGAARESGAYRVLVHLEEGLEGLGVIVFIRTLLLFAARSFGALTLRMATD